MRLLPVFFLAVALSTAHADAQAPQAGEWPDGAAFIWQCQKGSAGKIKFIFQTPEGKQYAGAISCGTPV